MENTTTTETNEVAHEIFRQINALDFRARARWGVKVSLADVNTLRFNCLKGIRIFIKLDASDTYSIEIGRMKGRFDYVKKAEVEGVYAESLVQVIDAEFSKAFGSL